MTGINNGLGGNISVGSPTATYEANVQAGSGALTGGSVAWQVFPTAFTSVPAVLVTNSKTVSSDINVVAGSTTLGSFYAEGETASDTFTWMAIGMKR